MSAARQDARRGGALVMLGVIVVGWVALRAILWEPPFMPASMNVLPDEEQAGARVRATSGQMVEDSGEALDSPPAEYVIPQSPEQVIPYWQPAPIPRQVTPPVPTPPPPPQISRTAFSRSYAGGRNIISHVLLLQAGYNTSDTNPPSPYHQALTDAHTAYTAQAADEMREQRAHSRWSMDAWALWREDSSSPLLSGRPAYGRSQMGAVVRFRLAPASGHRPQLYARASMALAGENEREAALGASARPIPAIPVRLALEGRLSDTDRGSELRAAAYAVTEFPPLDLPGGFIGEAYVQGGYVTGDFATPFVDGQARITRELAGTDDFRLEAGGGAWGGAQEDAGRLDVGPSAVVTFRIGEARGRVSADYRFRVAGDAQPASGPALTLTAGF